jgi:hypothetical protein
MHQADLIVLDPAPERRGLTPSVRRPAAARPRAAGGARVALLGNSKPNVDELFQGLAQGLREHSVTEIRILDKGSPTIPMSAGALDEVTGCCDLFVTAMAD